MTAFVLEPSKGGVKMTAVDSGVRDVRTARGAHRWIAGKLTMPYFAGLLSNLLEQPVVDETGLNGRYG